MKDDLDRTGMVLNSAAVGIVVYVQFTHHLLPTIRLPLHIHVHPSRIPLS